MAKRNRLPDLNADYDDPIYGVDLRSSLDDIQPGFARLLKNLIYDGGLTMRRGSTRLTANSLGAFQGRGGYRFYYTSGGTTTSKRLIAYSTNISVIDDGGLETVLTSGMTSDLDTHFKAWSIDQNVYISNGVDTIRKWDGTTFSTVTGTNIPTGKMVTPYLDRLFCIQGNGVVFTNPRVSNVWSPTTSSWAYLQPVGGAGAPTALKLHSATGKTGDPLAYLLIFQAGAVTAMTGTTFGSDVTAATAPTGYDASLILVQGALGTLSPYSVCTVPDYGTFWITQDRRIAWLPFGSTQARIVSDNIWSNQSSVYGINKINMAAVGQCSMIYHDRKLKVFIPVDSNSYPSIQFWLDLRLSNLAGSVVSAPNYHWTGPHYGQSVGRVWVEDQNNDLGTLYGLEANSVNGCYVYSMDQTNRWTDAVGSSDVSISSEYDTLFHDWKWPNRQKTVSRVLVNGQGNANGASVTLRELHTNTSQGGLVITDNNGNAFSSNQKWGTGVLWGSGGKWGSATQAFSGVVDLPGQGVSEFTGDRIAVEITNSTGPFTIDSITPEVQIRPNIPGN